MEPVEIYRERVYAYELYHQLRASWPEEEWPYSLGGEIDKTRHPIIWGDMLDKAKPDLLIHVPGDMGNNLVAIEIKPLTSRAQPRERKKFQNDLKKLSAFCKRPARYVAGFFIVFGDDIERVRKYARDLRETVDLRRVSLYHHSAPGRRAEVVDW